MSDAGRRAGVGRRRRSSWSSSPRSSRSTAAALVRGQRARPRGARRPHSAHASARSCSRTAPAKSSRRRRSAQCARVDRVSDVNGERRTTNDEQNDERRTTNDERMSIVYLIGAGPGRSRSHHRPRPAVPAAADVVLYDHLVPARLLRSRAAGRGADRRRHRRAAAARAGSDLLSARREGARGQDRRAAEVGRSVRVRQRRRRGAVSARAGRALRGGARHSGGHRGAGLRGHSDHLSRRRRHA